MPEIRRMEESDLDEVAAIERASFPLPWSRNLFLRDLKENKIAFFLAVRDRGELVAYGGFWLLQEEINIVNVAVHPDHRKKGFGRLVLDALLKEGQKQGATIATLEVRESNKAAINAQSPVASPFLGSVFIIIISLVKGYKPCAKYAWNGLKLFSGPATGSRLRATTLTCLRNES